MLFEHEKLRLEEFYSTTPLSGLVRILARQTARESFELTHQANSSETYVEQQQTELQDKES